ncbi:hypothetical protein ElyMa_003515100 [Elysia marginata]|uniref:Uncharacterized protein n=1 Tax=Elysia marginata TaxID=1093978 RepID=A0AAV4EGA9_9GAST|nr:hypothetical protein ElyMa_003515100 [Elysia marginata]
MIDPLTENILTEVMMEGDVSYTSVAQLADQNFSKRPMEALLSSQCRNSFSRNGEINVHIPDSLDIKRLSCIGGIRSSVNPLLAEYNFYNSFSTATPTYLLGDNHRSDMSCVKEKHNLEEYNTCSSLFTATPTCLLGDNHRSDTSCVKQKHNLRESPVLIKASAKQNQNLRESPVLSKQQLVEQDKLLIARRLKNQQVVFSVTISKISEKLDHILELSPCKNYFKQDLMHIDDGLL